MRFFETKIKDCIYIIPDIMEDNRGSFVETYSIGKYINEIGGNYWLQNNISVSQKNVLRGLHYQKGFLSQAKLVTVLNRSVRDVVVDCRESSPTFGEVGVFKLNSKTKHQIYVPRGCAHGFLSLEDNTIFMYQCDNIYNKKSESGIIFNDKKLNIDWGVNENELLVSKKDKELPVWEESYKFE